MNHLAKVCVVVGALALQLAGFTTFAKDKPPQPVQGLTVLDSNGKRVGNVLGFLSGPIIPAVAIRVDDQPLVLGVMPGQFFEPKAFFFEFADCAGTVYGDPVETFFDAFLIPAPVMANKVYLPDGSPRIVSIRSMYQLGGGCFSYEEEGRSIIPMRFVIDLNLYFTPPFTLR